MSESESESESELDLLESLLPLLLKSESEQVESEVGLELESLLCVVAAPVFPFSAACVFVDDSAFGSAAALLEVFEALFASWLSVVRSFVEVIRWSI